MYWAEQAIFTSIRGERLDGYQLAATSPGLSTDQAHELTQWGPAHDSLWPAEFAPRSIAWFRLSDGSSCLAVTQAAGGEYSGRSGPRIYTHFVVLPQAAVERLANPAWDTYHALQIAGRFIVRDPLPKRLERCPVVSTGSPPFASAEFPENIAAQLASDATPAEVTLAVVCRAAPETLLESLWQQLSPALRRETSFATGLRWSPRRPFRVQAIPADPALARQLGREPRVRVHQVGGLS